jgi:hypothetical protein
MPPDVLPKPVLGLVVAVVAVVSTSCSDGESSRAEPDPTTSAADAPTGDTTAPTPPATGSTGPDLPFPDVTPAAGLLLREKTVELRAPEGWRENPAMLTVDSGASGAPGEFLYLTDQRSMGSGLGLDALSTDQTAQLMLRSARSTGGSYERADDVVVDGVTLARISGTDDRGRHYEEVGVEREGRLVNLSVQVPPRTLEHEPDLLESVVNSWTWR